MSVRDNIELALYYLLILFLPTQLGYHFWPQFSYIQGLRIDYLSPTLFFTDLLFLFLLIKLFIKNKEKIPSFLKKNKPRILVAFFVAVILVVRLFYSENLWAGIYVLVKVLEIIVLMVYSAKIIKDKKSIDKIAICLSVGIIFEVLLGFLQITNQGSINGIFYFLGERFFTAETPGIANASVGGVLYLRPYGTFPHPNVFAGFLLISQIFLIGVIKVLRGEVKKILYLALTAAFIGILISFSRLTIILELILLAYYAFAYMKRAQQLNKKIFLSTLLVLLIFLSGFIALPRLINTNLNEEAVIQRQALISESLNMIVKNPIFGVGVNNFLSELSENKNPSTPLQPVHNFALYIASEIGIPLTLALLILCINLFTKTLLSNEKSNLSKREQVFLLLVIAALSLSDHYFRTIQQGQLFLAVIVGWVYGSTSAKTLKSKKKNIRR